MFFHSSYYSEAKWEAWNKGWRRNKKGSQIKADMLTLRPNINQLPGNREKKRDRGEEEGHQSMVHILRDAGAEKVCMPGFCMCVCVCVVRLG